MVILEKGRDGLEVLAATAWRRKHGVYYFGIKKYNKLETIETSETQTSFIQIAHTSQHGGSYEQVNGKISKSKPIKICHKNGRRIR